MYCGSGHHPSPHLPQEEAPHCYCSHQRGQQVSLPSYCRATSDFRRVAGVVWSHIPYYCFLIALAVKQQRFSQCDGLTEA